MTGSSFLKLVQKMKRLIVGTFTCVLIATGGVLSAREASAQVHFTDCVSMTGSDATLIVPGAAYPLVEGQPIAAGDEIALFTNEGICAGAGQWADADLVITIWGDDSITDSKDGFGADEAFSFRVWDSASETEAVDVAVTLSNAKPYFRTRSTYETNAIYVVASLEAFASGPVAPPSPVLSSPTHGQADVELDPTLVWRASNDAATYRIQVAADSFFTSILVDQAGLTDTTYQLSELAQSTSYSWRVRAENGAGPGVYSSLRAFATIETGEDNSPPLFVQKPPVTVKVGRDYSYEVLPLDADGDEIIVSADLLPSWLSFVSEGATATLSGTPTSADVGNHTVRLHAEDEKGARSAQSFTVTVSDAEDNAPPRAVARVAKLQMVAEKEVVAIDFVSMFEDDDGDSLSYQAQASMDGVVEILVEGSSILLEPLAPGIVVVEVAASDPMGEVAYTSFELEVAQTSAREQETPSGFALHQNYPNPFNPQTTIPYSLDRPGFVRVSLFNSVGQLVDVLENAARPAGDHFIELDAANLPTGMYYYRMEFESRAIARSLVVLR